MFRRRCVRGCDGSRWTHGHILITLFQQAPSRHPPQRIRANHEGVLTAPVRTDVQPVNPSGEPLEWDEPDVVTVYNYRRGMTRAICSCGWNGHSRHMKSMAVLDALLHAAQAGCDPSAPLVRVGSTR